MLSTSRLTLREATLDDAPALAAYQQDPRYLEHYADSAAGAPVGMDPPGGHPVGAEEIVRLARQWAATSPRRNYQLIVCLGDASGPVIGCAGLRQIGYPMGEAEVGIELNPLHWAAGFATETLSELIRFARHELGLRQLWAFTSPGNRRAHRLLKRLGFSPEPEADPPEADPAARFTLRLASA